MERDFKDKYLFKRGRGNGIGFALFLILFGGIYLFLNLGIIPIEYKRILISWQMLLIVLGIWSLLKRQFVGAFFLIAIGFFFIYPVLCSVFPEYFVRFDVDIKTYWPVLLIAGGVLLVISRSFPSPKKDYNKEYRHESTSDHYNPAEQNSADYVDKNLMFGSSEQIVLSQNFKGGEANVMFGELIIDLRRANLSEFAGILEANVMFGSIVIYTPSDWAVELKSSSLLGSFEDKRYHPSDKISEIGVPRLVIKGSAMFGSGEIRN